MPSSDPISSNARERRLSPIPNFTTPASSQRTRHLTIKKLRRKPNIIAGVQAGFQFVNSTSAAMAASPTLAGRT
jgi:hypothetical protein